MSGAQAQRFTSNEMEQLMDRVQELLEANVIAMVVRTPTGRVSVTCPPQWRQEVVTLFRSYDWASWEPD